VGAAIVLERRSAISAASSDGDAESSGAGLGARLGSTRRFPMAIGSGGIGTNRVVAGGGGNARGPAATSSASRSMCTADAVATGGAGLNGVNSQFLASDVSDPPGPALRRLDETVDVERIDSWEGETLRRCDCGCK
jgi:hypothetical protein